MTWDEDGKLVPLDERQQQRLMEIARECSWRNPPLPDNRVLSRQETRRLVWLDVAHLLDDFFRLEHQSLPFVVSATPPLILALFLAYITPCVWPLLLVLAAIVGGFRLWVWYCLEHPRRRGR